MAFFVDHALFPRPLEIHTPDRRRCLSVTGPLRNPVFINEHIGPNDLGAGMARYSLVYGSLGTVVALMFWLYLSASITFLGAHLAATVASRR